MKIINDKVFGLDLLRRRQFERKKDLINYHANKIRELEKEPSSSDTLLANLANKTILFEHLYEGRRLEIDMASHLESIDKDEGIRDTLDLPIEVNVNELILEDSPIKFNFYDNKYLIIDTPIVFKNAERIANTKDLLMLGTFISAVRRHYENEHEMSLKGQIKSPYWVIFIRKIPGENYQNFADSDNIELKKVSNIITSFLFLSDSPKDKSDCTLTQVVDNREDVGLTIAVMEEQYAVNFIDNFIKNNSLDFIK